MRLADCRCETLPLRSLRQRGRHRALGGSGGSAAQGSPQHRRKPSEKGSTPMLRPLAAWRGALPLSALLSLAAAPALAQISDDVVKIGVLTDLSGPASDATGQGSVLAAEMAVADFGGKVDGVPIQVVSANHQLKPDIGAEIATRWYDVDKVDLIVDVPVSAVGLAVQEVARKKQKLFITHSTGTADFTGKFCSPYGMQWVFDTYALATGTAREVVKRGGQSWFFVTADYAFGHSLERDASRVVQENG